MDISVPGKKNKIDILKDIVDCTTIITQNILSFENGFRLSYKVVASQLRILLCDISKRGNKNNSLILKIFPDFKLHPLSYTLEDVKKNLKGRLLYFTSGTLASNSNRIYDIFNVNDSPIDLDKWLNQNILDEEITILKLITSVTNKDGGAHVDLYLDRTLRKTMSSKTNEIEDHKIYIVEIGRYIVEVISQKVLGLINVDQNRLKKIFNI
ncbi:MAG: hypothetical protein KAW56_17125 [Candidatus Marinimicrobia bacterium]|nr:hypothetical protein [Candidatus Neomarinimicrobiota bacterium]